MSNSLVVFCVLGVGILIGVGIYVHRSRRSKRSPPQTRPGTTENELDPETLRVVRDRLEAFERDSLAFELFLAGNRVNLSAEDRTRLTERFGRVVQEPVLVLSDLAQQGLDFGAVRACVAVVLRERGLALDESQTFGRAASEAIRVHARERAACILRGEDPVRA
jgi:hypothetical protein